MHMHIYPRISLINSSSTDQTKGTEPLFLQPTPATLRAPSYLHLFGFSFLGLFYFRLAACFHASRLARLSPAYLRRAHNRCLSCITGPFRTPPVPDTPTHARPRSVLPGP